MSHRRKCRVVKGLATLGEKDPLAGVHQDDCTAALTMQMAGESATGEGEGVTGLVQPGVDLVREGTKMRELHARLAKTITPLNISSSAAQIVLRQF